MNDKTLKLVIGNYNYSSWSMRPWIFLRQNEIPFETRWISLFTGSMHAELKGHFSNFKVPILIDDGFEVWDTISILEYINEKFPQAEGWPNDSRARAFARSLSAEMHSSFSALRNAMPMNCRKRFIDYKYNEAVEKDIERIKQLVITCRDRYGTVGPWLFGRYTIADAMYTPVVMRFKGYAANLDLVTQEYCETVFNSKAVGDWLNLAKSETEVIAEDEIDWAYQSAW